MAGHRGHPERSLRHRRPQPGHTHTGSHRQWPPSTRAVPRGTWSGRLDFSDPHEPHGGPGLPPPPPPRSQPAPQNPLPTHTRQADPVTPTSTRPTRVRPPGPEAKARTRGMRTPADGGQGQHPKGGAGSGPTWGCPSAAREPLGGKASAGRSGGEGAHTQGKGPQGQGHGSPPGGLRRKPQARPGPPGKDDHGIRPPQTRGRPLAPPQSPLTSPGPRHQGAPKRPQRQAQHQGITPGISSIPDPAPLRETGTPHRGGRFPGPRRPEPLCHMHSAAVSTGNGSARERAESRLTAEGGHAPEGRHVHHPSSNDSLLPDG